MISQTQTASNQYGFYAVPKKLQPKKKYRQSQYEDFQDNQEQDEVQFQQIERQKISDNAIQRDFYVDEAPYPQFKPKQRGLDYGVQIERGDLFDFDLQVQPLLQILVGRSVVSAINQLQEDKEKIQKKEKLQKYQKKRNAQLMVTQRLEAKSKRKKQQSERRVLQKQIYVKNQKQAGKKVIARKSAKNSLLGLKNQIISQLQQAGYLRSQTYTDLRINYEGWLYEQITNLIKEDKKIVSQVQKIIRQVENENQDEHKKKISKQKKRRQQILDQRQRIKKLNQQKKQKKRIKKQRLQLNSQREAQAIKLDQLLQKFHQIENVIKFENRSNGLTLGTGNCIYISGGLLNFIVAILNSSQKNFSPQEIEQIIAKIVAESNLPLQFEFSQEHLNLIQQQMQLMQANANSYMNGQSLKVQALKQKISLNLKLLQLTNVHVKQNLHQALLEALLNIVLTTTAIPKLQEGSEELAYEPTDKDKQRQQLKKKIQLNVFKHQALEQLATVLRIRFERKYPQQNQSKKSQKPEPSQDQWVDIYDGLGWDHHCKQYPEQANRENQRPSAFNISSYERAFIFDERTLYYLRRQIIRLLELPQPSPSIDTYISGLAHINTALNKNIPIYDSQVRME